MHNHPHTSFNLSPLHHRYTAATEHSPPSSPGPSNKHTNDTDPETPSNRMHIIYSNLGVTSGGSLLVSKNCISSAYKVAAPTFEVAPLLPELDWTLLQKRNDADYQSRNSLLQQNVALTKSLH